MEQKQTRRSTGIPSLDAEVEDIKKMPKQILQPTYEFPSSFPRCNIKKPQSDASTVFVVGAGWYFPRAVTALVPAGAKVVAYEMDENKVGRGQMGNTVTDDVFKLPMCTGSPL
jgi:hypothetical protein